MTPLQADKNNYNIIQQKAILQSQSKLIEMAFNNDIKLHAYCPERKVCVLCMAKVVTRN